VGLDFTKIVTLSQLHICSRGISSGQEEQKEI